MDAEAGTEPVIVAMPMWVTAEDMSAVVTTECTPAVATGATGFPAVTGSDDTAPCGTRDAFDRTAATMRCPAVGATPRFGEAATSADAAAGTGSQGVGVTLVPIVNGRATHGQAVTLVLSGLTGVAPASATRAGWVKPILGARLPAIVSVHTVLSVV